MISFVYYPLQQADLHQPFHRPAQRALVKAKLLRQLIL
jgi:hypothetical protein